MGYLTRPWVGSAVARKWRYVAFHDVCYYVLVGGRETLWEPEPVVAT